MPESEFVKDHPHRWQLQTLVHSVLDMLELMSPPHNQSDDDATPTANTCTNPPELITEAGECNRVVNHQSQVVPDFDIRWKKGGPH